MTFRATVLANCRTYSSSVDRHDTNDARFSSKNLSRLTGSVGASWKSVMGTVSRNLRMQQVRSREVETSRGLTSE